MEHKVVILNDKAIWLLLYIGIGVAFYELFVMIVMWNFVTSLRFMNL